MTRILALVALTISAPAFAQDPSINYDQVTVLSKDWHLQGTPFCYKTDAKPEQQCLTLSDMGEVKLRENGSRADDHGYLDQLSPESQSVVNQYAKFFVRYLSLDSSRFL